MPLTTRILAPFSMAPMTWSGLIRPMGTLLLATARTTLGEPGTMMISTAKPFFSKIFRCCAT